MKPLKTFEEYHKKGIVKKQRPNKLRADDLVKEAERKSSSLIILLDKIGLNDENANDIIEDCYDILISLIRAKMLLSGFNSSGIGAHEAEVAYMKNLDFLDTEIRFMNELRYFRNGIMYYGKRFDKEYAEKVLNFLKKIKEKLNKKS